MVPAGIILMWSGTNVSIPSGWLRETTLDSKYPKATAASVNPNVTGGTATHSHTSAGHTHTMSSHSHTVSIPQWNDSTTGDNSNPLDLTGTHNHPDFVVTGPSGGSLQSTAPTWQAIASDPAFYSPIFIKSNYGFLQDGIIGLWATASGIPAGWALCDGTNGTPDMRNKYLNGASVGADAGATGGTFNHSHTIDHTHTANAHTHNGTTSSSTSGYLRQNEANDSNKSYLNHTHSTTLDGTVDTLAAYTGSSGSGDTIEPGYKKLAAIKNLSGGINKPKRIIGMWLGTLATIPAGWFLCDGTNGTQDMRSYHIKIANLLSEIGNIGGSNTHSHTSASHQHASSGTHNHTGSTGNDGGTGKAGLGGHGTTPSHTHSLSGVTGTSASYSTDNLDSISANGEPLFRTVAFIQYRFIKGMTQII